MRAIRTQPVQTSLFSKAKSIARTSPLFSCTRTDTVKFGHEHSEDGSCCGIESKPAKPKKVGPSFGKRLKTGLKEACRAAFSWQPILKDLIWSSAFATILTLLSGGFAGGGAALMVPIAAGASMVLRGVLGFVHGYQKAVQPTPPLAPASEPAKTEEKQGD